MSDVPWKVRVLLYNLTTGKKRWMEGHYSDRLTTDIVLKLAQVKARFIFEGVHYYGEAPCVDPIKGEVVYICEGYELPPEES